MAYPDPPVHDRQLNPSGSDPSLRATPRGQEPQHGDGEIVSTNRARQGPPGRPVLLVLVSSLILAALAMVIMLYWGVVTPPTMR